MRNYSVSEVNCLTIPLEMSLKPKYPYYTIRLSLFILFTAAIMKRHSEHTKHIFKYLASESKEHCKYGECCSSQHSCLCCFSFRLPIFHQKGYSINSPPQVIHLLTFYASCVPKDSACLEGLFPNLSALLFQDLIQYRFTPTTSACQA